MFGQYEGKWGNACSLTHTGRIWFMLRTRLKRICTRLVTVLSLVLILAGSILRCASTGYRWTDMAIDATMPPWAETRTQNGVQAIVNDDFGATGSLH